jgi:hypothetical protein
MRAYLAYDDSGIKELGAISKDDLPSLIEQADASLTTDKQYGVGLYRSEKDFLEVRPVGKSEYLIWSDRLVPRRLRDLFRVKIHIDRVVIGREAALQAMLYWMDNSREAFEQKYG